MITAMTSEVKKAVAQLKEVLAHHPNGIGLSAPQVGYSLRIIHIRYQNIYLTLLNPEILHGRGRQTNLEGCLSLPGICAEVPRREKILISGMNSFGRRLTLELTGMLAAAAQHEVDHLNGILFLDRVENWDSLSLTHTSLPEEFSKRKR